MSSTAATTTVVDHSVKLKLTGNPFVDTGLACLAALSGCRRIEDLTVDKIREVHGEGTDLANNNIRMESNTRIFTRNTITTQNSYSPADRITKYAAITRALVEEIGHETVDQYCDFCDNSRCIDFTRLAREHIDPEVTDYFIARNWFPLTGSMGSDAQALPSASRGLHSCAKCLLAVQYLPQCSILVHGRLALFQSTSINLWYSWMKRLTLRVKGELSSSDASNNSSNKIRTLGTGFSSRFASLQLLDAIEDMSEDGEYDPDMHMIMYTFTNTGTSASISKEFIPGFALNFLHEAAQYGFANEIRTILARETKNTRYYNSFLKCISDGRDYWPLYPFDLGKRWNGASPGLFRSYQRYIIGHSDSILNTAYKIADYIKQKTHTNADLEKLGTRRKKVKRFVVQMVEEGLVSFSEYYNFFVRDPLDSRSVWRLIRYYLLNSKELEPGDIGSGATDEVEVEIFDQEYRDRIVAAGTAIYDLFATEGITTVKKLLVKFATGKINKRWLRRWYENAELDYDNKELDYRMIELFHVLFTARSAGHL
jgi:CRISPR-associated protein Cst1